MHVCKFCGRKFETGQQLGGHVILCKKNPENTHKNYKCGYYQGIWCDSSWELAYILYQKDHNIEVERNLTPYEYVFEGKTYKFYPDFIVNGELVEIKGFFDAKNIAKKEQVKNVIFIGTEEMKPILKYVIQKYGNDFTSLYSR